MSNQGNPEPDPTASSSSYAKIVLNLKPNECDKEIIHDASADKLSKKCSNILPSVTEKDNKKAVLSDVPDDDSFTPVISHSRKERRNEKRKSIERKVAFDGSKDNREVKEIRQDKHQVKNINIQDNECATESENPKPVDNEVNEEVIPKKFVEAPLPKINAWQVNYIQYSAVLLQ